MTTDAASLSTMGAIRRTLKEVPILADKLWLILILNLGGTAVQLLIPVIVQLALDRYVGQGTDVDLPGIFLVLAGGYVRLSPGCRNSASTSSPISWPGPCCTYKQSAVVHSYRGSPLTSRPCRTSWTGAESRSS